jgi:signal peptidase II
MRVRLALAGLGVALLTGIDLVTKEVAKDRLRGGPPVTIIPGFWDMKYAENRDVGFSLLQSIPHDIRQPLIFALVLMGLGAVLVYGVRRLAMPRALSGVVLIASGALGNLIDRAMNGYVTDFVHWFIGRHSWPVFNVADICVVVGVALVLWQEWTTAPEPVTPEAGRET